MRPWFAPLNDVRGIRAAGTAFMPRRTAHDNVNGVTVQPAISMAAPMLHNRCSEQHLLLILIIRYIFYIVD
jgi:hypothetical protein